MSYSVIQQFHFWYLLPKSENSLEEIFIHSQTQQHRTQHLKCGVL